MALRLYERERNVKVEKSGLIVHKKYTFLGGSPDGLVGKDGLIEIKCPSKIRGINSKHWNLDFLDNRNQLKMTHNYYFQIQGYLELSNRIWCDFVVYSTNEIKIERINRNNTFWNGMINRLKEFYFFYYLPELLKPDTEIDDNMRK